MKIAILGTRGIPNYHGGFEQFAEYFSVFLVKQGHDVYVYNSSTHPYKEKTFQGVKIIHCSDPEEKVGAIGQFFYDLNCIIDSRKRKFHIILQLGYTSSSIWNKLMPKSAIVVTNMDGLEWKRSKYSKLVQKYLVYAEKLAVKNSDYLVSDSVGIKDYIQSKYKKKSNYIPYGAKVFSGANEDFLKKYNLAKFGYNMLIARLEPENNIETILDGVVRAKNQTPFLVIGKHDVNKFGKTLKEKFKCNKNIKFIGGVYDITILNNLRFFSNLYFHGHSVGGTNPSLLEAMASNALIVAHDNIFNKSILKEDAFYFKSPNEVAEKIDALCKNEHSDILKQNKKKIETIFNWDIINKQYLDLLIEVNGL
ncbi:DUF1972 domain-containing protein [Flavisericum labens]|uniref:DUF1972 domain-containing protein n=1 Tax=Flavisericum labens TaxID=3377112 RepID=UPI00387B3870